MKSNAVADNIRRRREAHHWTQEEFAQIAGVDVRTVQRAENGKPLSVETLRAIAAAFDTTIDDLKAPPVDPEDLAKQVAEFEKKFAVIDLTPVVRAADLSRFFGAEAHMLQKAGDFSEPEADAIADFEQELKDSLDLWGDLEPVQRRDLERTLQEVLDRLRNLNLTISAGSEDLNLCSNSTDSRLSMRVLHAAVVQGNEPLPFLLRRKGVPIALG